uniref:Signal recognition particle receptor subunit beta n=2 Tax=Psilocybe cubensis TaxID=181762 RepID=A0A8H7Y2X6_PSICU
MCDKNLPCDPEVVPLSTTITPTSLAIASLIVALVIVAAIFFLTKKSSKSRGNTFLLVGPPDAGKTSILSQLAYSQTLPTQTSMQINSAGVTLSQSKSIRVVDVPGHARLRNQFEEYLPETKVVGFVVDASTISRNAPAVAEHLHHILHALTSFPPSQQPPLLVILAHKADLFKSTSSSNANTSTLAINRVKAILERELEKRRASQSGGVNVEGLGEEGERADMGGLECGEKEGSAFKFDEWEGGDVVFLGTSIVSSSSEKVASEGSLETLWEFLADNM